MEAGPVFVQGFLVFILTQTSMPPLCWSCCLRWAQCGRGGQEHSYTSSGSSKALPVLETSGKAFFIHSLG